MGHGPLLGAHTQTRRCSPCTDWAVEGGHRWSKGKEARPETLPQGGTPSGSRRGCPREEGEKSSLAKGPAHAGHVDVHGVGGGWDGWERETRRDGASRDRPPSEKCSAWGPRLL